MLALPATKRIELSVTNVKTEEIRHLKAFALKDEAGVWEQSLLPPEVIEDVGQKPPLSGEFLR